jgi:diguanylate cyclase (GGDEF)-like protein/PAS domain S-box-containing protein
MTFILKHRLFIILSILLAVIVSASVTFSYTQAKRNLHQAEQKLAQNYFSALNIAYQATQYHIDSINHADINSQVANKFSFIFKRLTSEFNVNAAILLDENYMGKKAWSDAIQQGKNNTPAINGLIIAETSSDQITSLISAIADHHHVNRQDTLINVEIRSFNNHTYLYSTKPLHSYLGSEYTNEFDLSQIVIWQDITERYLLLNKQLRTTIYYAIAVFLLVELLILLSLRRLSDRLNRVIRQQSIELNSRNEVLKQLVQGKTLATILESIVLSIEQIETEASCSILLLDSEGKHLLHAAAPHLPDFYNEAINGVEIGHGVGSCGTAAFTKTRVIVEDIQSHPLWLNYRELAARANLAACWSEPIIGTNKTLLGSFAIYHHQPTSPSKAALKLIESAAQLAAVVIEHKRADEQQLLSSRVFNSAREGIIVSDSQGKIITVNPMFSVITGYSREEVIGKNPKILNSGKHSDEFFKEMWRSVTAQGHWQGEVWNRKKNGQLFAELLTISSLIDEAGLPSHFVGLFSDITNSKEQQQSLELMAHYDVLTRLPNRALFADRFERSIAHSKRNKTLLAICFLDLDNFKPINDNHGHDIGDQLLIEVAARLTRALRDEDTVSRQGGDEFALLMADFESIEQCKALLNRIHRSLAQPYLIEEETHYISASSGTTIYPLDDADIDTLIRHADQAMYQAKLAGKNNYRLFNAGDNQKIITQHTRLQEIKLALQNNEFCLYYQPKVNMKTGKVFGFEALIRWLHPQKGLIPPLSFLPVLDGTALEIELGNWVINTALKQAEIWKKQGIDLEISVNISSAHLQSAAFITELNEALLRHPTIEPNNFQLEILESSALGDLETIRSIIQTCRELLDVNIALDDFGTGYSSLTHLRILHVNTIKIDQSFIRDMLDDPNDYAIIEGIIGLADSFDRTVIAEGVETADHGITLLLMGCNEAQGYEISRPLPAENVLNWLENYRPNQQWINYGSQKRTLKETKIKLLLLATHHWYETFKHKQSASSEGSTRWPLMNPKHCHHGAWLKRARDEQLFNKDWLQKLEQAHEKMHQIATDIMLKHQNKNATVTSEDLNTLQQAYESMILILKPDSKFSTHHEAT